MVNLNEERGARLYQLLEAMKVSQAAFAKRIGVAQSFINRIVSGQKGISSTVIGQIAGLYPKVNVQWLLTGEGDMFLQTLEPDGTVGPMVVYSPIDDRQDPPALRRRRQIVVAPLAAQAGFTNSFYDEWADQQPQYIDFGV